MGRYKIYKYSHVVIDNKLLHQITDIQMEKKSKSFREASKDLADYIERVRWELKKHR